MNALGMWEGRLLLWIQENIRAGWTNKLMVLITSLGDEGMLWIALSLMLILFKKTRRIGVCCALSLILTYLSVNLCLKPLVSRARPYTLLQGLEILVKQPGDNSFPSGHSAHALAFCWVIFRKMKRKIGVPALVLGLLVALSRLHVGVHFPTDVIAGCLIGIGMAVIAMSVVENFKFGSKT